MLKTSNRPVVLKHFGFHFILMHFTRIKKKCISVYHGFKPSSVTIAAHSHILNGMKTLDCF